MRKRILFLPAAVAFCLVFSGCAAPRPAPDVSVFPGDRVLLVLAPFDSSLKAELEGVRLDPLYVQEEMGNELLYQLALRRVDLTWDSEDATVVLTLMVRRLEADFGAGRTFGKFSMLVWRETGTSAFEWDWRAQIKDAVPRAFVERHLARLAASEVLGRIRSTRTNKNPPGLDYPPPLILLQ